MNIKSVKSKVVVAALGALVVVGGVTGVSAYTATAADANPAAIDVAAKGDAVTSTDTLSTDAALTAAKAALKEAEKQDQRVVVAIVDRSGNTVALVKGDGAGPQSEQSALRKAFTAAAFGRPTSELAEAASGDAPNIADIPGTLFLAGGVPVTADDAPIAGIGVGGAPSGDIDEEIAQAGLAAIG